MLTVGLLRKPESLVVSFKGPSCLVLAVNLTDSSCKTLYMDMFLPFNQILNKFVSIAVKVVACIYVANCLKHDIK